MFCVLECVLNICAFYVCLFVFDRLCVFVSFHLFCIGFMRFQHFLCVLYAFVVFFG